MLNCAAFLSTRRIFFGGVQTSFGVKKLRSVFYFWMSTVSVVGTYLRSAMLNCAAFLSTRRFFCVLCRRVLGDKKLRSDTA
jgi:hypothetical protein